MNTAPAEPPLTPPPNEAPAVATGRLPHVRGGAALLVAGGLGALGLFLLVAAPGPFWAVVAGAAVLWPVRTSRAGRAVTLALGIVAVGWVLSLIGGVLAPFVAVFVVAYVLDPVVTWAARRGVPRWATTLGVVLALVGVVAGALVWLVPTAAAQVESLVTGAVALVQRLPEIARQSAFLDRLEAAGIVDRDALLSRLGEIAPQQIRALAERVPALVAFATQQVGAVVGLLTTAALVPVLLFYTLKDFPTLRDGLVSLLPRVDGGRPYVSEIGRVFGSYVRGQLLISVANGLLVGIPLFLFGVPFSLVLGIVAGLLNIVPSIGSILTYVLALTLMLAFGTASQLAITAGVLVVQAIIEQAVLTPTIMGNQVNLHPVVILVALFSAGALFGILGLLLAVPAAALIASAIRTHRDAFVLDLDTPAAADPQAA